MKTGWVRVVKHWRIVGWVAVWLAIALALTFARDGQDTATRVQRQRVHDNTTEIALLHSEVTRERADVALLCRSAKANRGVIRDLVERNGSIALASVNTAKIRAREPYLAAVIDLLVAQMRAAAAAQREIIDRPIPCATR